MTVLLVANQGGHLTQLFALRSRLGFGEDVAWITTDTSESRSLLAGEQVYWTGPARPRNGRDAARNTAEARKVLGSRDFTKAVSTGASLAVSVLPQASARGVQSVYIESATRMYGPSLTGRILAKIPGVETFTQNEDWADEKWRYIGSPWDRFYAADGIEKPVRSAVVALGTQDEYPFERLISRVHLLLPRDADILWQTGATDVSRYGISGRNRVDPAELNAAMRDADVVIAHAGTGVALSALEQGKTPVLIPRRARHGEHIDDHQLQTALALAMRGLAIVRDADHLTERDLHRAAAMQAVEIGGHIGGFASALRSAPAIRESAATG